VTAEAGILHSLHCASPCDFTQFKTLQQHIIKVYIQCSL